MTEFIEDENPVTRADILIENLRDYIFSEENVLYIFDKTTITYKPVKGKHDDEIVTVMTRYLTESLKKIMENPERRDHLQLKFKKKLTDICKNPVIKSCMEQLTTGLVREDVFKQEFYKIHYKNCFIDLKTKEVKERVFKTDYCNHCINRDYKPSTKEERKTIFEHMKKIYPKKEDFEAIKFILGSALTGKATKEQYLLSLNGLGSAGKSMIMELTELALTPCYFEKMESVAFSESNPNKNKSFSTFHKRKWILVIWVNEPKKTKMDAELVKDFVDGKIKGQLLYKDGSFEFSHRGLVIFTANSIISFHGDSGINRRIRGYYHKSNFTEDKSKVDETKNIYLKNEKLLDELNKDNLLNAWLDILFEYSFKYANGEKLKLPESFKEATDEIIDMNDEFAPFVSKMLTKTDNHTKDFINKKDMYDSFKKMYPTKYPNDAIILSGLREKGLTYNSQKEFRGIKGCYTGVIFKKEGLEVLPENDPHFKVEELELKLLEQSKQMKELQKKYDELVFCRGNQIPPKAGSEPCLSLVQNEIAQGLRRSGAPPLVKVNIEEEEEEEEEEDVCLEICVKTKTKFWRAEKTGICYEFIETTDGEEEIGEEIDDPSIDDEIADILGMTEN
jgi:hypothetical protein